MIFYFYLMIKTGQWVFDPTKDWVTKKSRYCVLTQTGLIEKVTKAGGMEDCNKCTTPVQTTPVGDYIDGEAFNETWEYDSVVGMLMYIAISTIPDISYAVHQAAMYSHGTRNSHELSVKRILRYLEGTLDKGIIFKPNKSNTIDCRVDSDFTGLFAVEDGPKPICAKSRTGYVIKLCDVPMCTICKLKLLYQLWQQITLSYPNRGEI
jgi:hypothetical protein